MSAQIETGPALAILAKLLGRTLDPVPFFDYVGAIEVQNVRERIMHTKLDPDGSSWTPWTNYTAELREFKGNYDQGIMWDSGDLLNSVHFDVDGAFGVDIGSDIWYAALQQDGVGKLPSRPIFGWEPSQILHFEQAFVTFLEEGVL